MLYSPKQPPRHHPRWVATAYGRNTSRTSMESCLSTFSTSTPSLGLSCCVGLAVVRPTYPTILSILHTLLTTLRSVFLGGRHPPHPLPFLQSPNSRQGIYYWRKEEGGGGTTPGSAPVADERCAGAGSSRGRSRKDTACSRPSSATSAAYGTARTRSSRHSGPQQQD